MQRKTVNISFNQLLRQKLRDYSALVKFRLSFLVVTSAVMGYLLAGDNLKHWQQMLMLALGGFFVTGASNALNEVFEKDYDRLMKRTEKRPLPTGSMSSVEALIAAGVMGVSGIIILSAYFNLLAGMLSALSLISYAFIYTPLKRLSPVAVFVGAIPGALPPLIGYVAHSNSITLFAAIIFFIQFIWQFPHFWSIAWVAFDDYKKAGFMLLPSKEGKTKYTALLTLIYTFALIPICFLAFYYNYVGVAGTICMLLFSFTFFWFSFRFYRACDDAAARKLMFASFFHLPLVQLAMVLDKV